jgi:dienelactone hydrolase
VSFNPRAAAQALGDRWPAGQFREIREIAGGSAPGVRDGQRPARAQREELATMKTIPRRYLAGVLLSAALAAAPLASHAAEASAEPAPGLVAPEASMNERVLMVLVDAQQGVRLVVTLLQPDGPGPFPLAVMNHGASGKTPRAQMPRYRHTFSAYYFLSRGYAVALPMLRGHGGSEGDIKPFGCNHDSVAQANARDLQAVLDFLATQPGIDASRSVMAGQSFGGWNTLAYGALGDPRVKGLLNFAGGMTISNCPSTTAALARGAERFGATTRVPSIWFYGENDSYFGAPVWQAMLSRYTAMGAKAQMVAFGPFMKDAHNLLGYPEGLAIWAPKADAFLTQIGLPAAVTHPEYLPHDFPPPSGYAALDDVEAVPYVAEKGREQYGEFLKRPLPRAFVLSPTGFSAWFYGGFDPIGRGLKVCGERSRDCFVYAVDEHVVWSRPTPAPPPTRPATPEDAAAIPFVTESGRQGWLRYLGLRRPKAFVIAPDGAWSAAALGPDPLVRALEQCGKAHQGCRLYAVDQGVVWAAEP